MSPTWTWNRLESLTSRGRPAPEGSRGQTAPIRHFDLTKSRKSGLAHTSVPRDSLVTISAYNQNSRLTLTSREVGGLFSYLAKLLMSLEESLLL